MSFGTPNSHSVMGDYDGGARIFVKINLLQRDLSQPEISAAALLEGPQQHDSSVASWRKGSKVGESLISSYQPALLALNPRPDHAIGEALPPLRYHGCCVVTMSCKKVSRLSGQVLVNLDLQNSILAVRVERNKICVVDGFGGEPERGANVFRGELWIRR